MVQQEKKPILNHKKKMYVEVDFEAFIILEQDRLAKEKKDQKNIPQKDYYAQVIEDRAWDMKKTKF